jgi:hypothetical protein
MAGVITRAGHYKELQEGLNAVFGKEYRSYAEIWRGLVDVETSSKAFEEEVMTSDFGLVPEKAEGASVDFDTAADAWVARYDHRTYALAFAITQEAEEDGLYGSLGARYSKALAASFQETKEVNVHAIYNNAFTAGVWAGGDGVALLSTSHPLYGGGTLSNTLAVAADLSEQALEDAITQVGDWTDERGKFINVMVTKLVIPTELKFTAERLLMSPYRPGTGDNDINAVKSMGVIPGGYVSSPYLTDPDSWYLRTNCPNGLKHFVRVKMQRGLEGDFATGNVKYKGRERYSTGVSNWRGLFGSPGG